VERKGNLIHDSNPGLGKWLTPMPFPSYSFQINIITHALLSTLYHTFFK